MHYTHVCDGIVAINQIQTVIVHSAADGQCRIELVESGTQNTIDEGVKNTAFGNVQPLMIRDGQAEFKLRVMSLSSRHNGCKFRFKITVGNETIFTDEFKTLSKQPSSSKRKLSTAQQYDTDVHDHTKKSNDTVDPIKLLQLVEQDPYWFLKDVLKQLQDVRAGLRDLQDEKRLLTLREDKLFKELHELEESLSCIVSTEGYTSGYD